MKAMNCRAITGVSGWLIMSAFIATIQWGIGAWFWVAFAADAFGIVAFIGTMCLLVYAIDGKFPWR